jgi:hypothetical protein
MRKNDVPAQWIAADWAVECWQSDISIAPASSISTANHDDALINLGAFFYVDLIRLLKSSHSHRAHGIGNQCARSEMLL